MKTSFLAVPRKKNPPTVAGDSWFVAFEGKLAAYSTELNRGGNEIVALVELGLDFVGQGDGFVAGGEEGAGQ